MILLNKNERDYRKIRIELNKAIFSKPFEVVWVFKD
jgi:hypothetical protein